MTSIFQDLFLISFNIIRRSVGVPRGNVLSKNFPRNYFVFMARNIFHAGLAICESVNVSISQSEIEFKLKSTNSYQNMRRRFVVNKRDCDWMRCIVCAKMKTSPLHANSSNSVPISKIINRIKSDRITHIYFNLKLETAPYEIRPKQYWNSTKR